LSYRPFGPSRSLNDRVRTGNDSESSVVRKGCAWPAIPWIFAGTQALGTLAPPTPST